MNRKKLLIFSLSQKADIWICVCEKVNRFVYVFPKLAVLAFLWSAPEWWISSCPCLLLCRSSLLWKLTLWKERISINHSKALCTDLCIYKSLHVAIYPSLKSFPNLKKVVPLPHQGLTVWLRPVHSYIIRCEFFLSVCVCVCVRACESVCMSLSVCLSSLSTMHVHYIRVSTGVYLNSAPHSGHMRLSSFMCSDTCDLKAATREKTVSHSGQMSVSPLSASWVARCRRRLASTLNEAPHCQHLHHQNYHYIQRVQGLIRTAVQRYIFPWERKIIPSSPLGPAVWMGI